MDHVGTYEFYRLHAHYLIDGMAYQSTTSAYRTALEKGFTGTRHAFCVRLSKLKNPTWKELLTPLDATRSEARKKTLVSKREEMHRICAELDKRKEALANAT